MAKLREIPNGDGEQRSAGAKRERKPKQKEETRSLKYYFFLALFLFPSLAWVISVGGDLISNVGGVFGSMTNGIVISLPLVVPLLVAIYSKKLRGLMLKGVLPIAVAVLLFPTIQVYLCSPIELRNEDIGTKFSLKTTAAQFLEQSCMEECLNKSKFPTSYRLSLSTPRVGIRLQSRQVVDHNLTISAMVNGEPVKVARLLLLPSWRSVRGRYHALNILARIPLKVKKLDQALEDKKDMIMSGRVVKVPTDLLRLKGQLEKQKRFIRPFMLDVFRVTPLEPAEEQKEDKQDEPEDEDE